MKETQQQQQANTETEDGNTQGKVTDVPRVEREQWASQAEFIFSCISMSVGIGNVWRFPFVALDNGGGAFLIPYIIVLFFVGIPLYYMEICLGQFASFGMVKVWEISPAFKGIGYGQAVCTWAVVTFYVSLMALCTFYFFASFSSVLPWSLCGSWASPSCIDLNSSVEVFANSSNLITASEEYYTREVLKTDPLGYDSGLGLPDWRLVLCLLFSWVTVFFVLWKGVQSSGKASYFTALFPYVVLIILLVRGVTLPGAYKGILYFITPKWEKLLEPAVWFAAIQQVLFGLGIGFGLVITLASYNPFRQNAYRDAALINFMEIFTCFLAGFTIFSILGNLAEILGVEVEDVVKGGGTSLAFITYPNVLARFQYVPQLFATLFFLMLFTLGLGSAVFYNSCIITIICDKYPHIKQWKVALGVCIIGFLAGLVYTTPQGQHTLTLINHYAGIIPITPLMIIEIIVVMWVYGLRSFLRDIEFMLKRKTGIYWKICWGVFNPIFLIVVFVYSQVTAKPLKYGDYVIGIIPTTVGISLATLACLMVPFFMVVEIVRRRKGSLTTWEAIKDAFRPSAEWCPKDPTIHREYQQCLQ